MTIMYYFENYDNISTQKLFEVQQKVINLCDENITLTSEIVSKLDADELCYVFEWWWSVFEIYMDNPRYEHNYAALQEEMKKRHFY